MRENKERSFFYEFLFGTRTPHGSAYGGDFPGVVPILITGALISIPIASIVYTPLIMQSSMETERGNKINHGSLTDSLSQDIKFSPSK